VLNVLLLLPDGEPADPATFLTAVPNWEPGETFRTGDGARWRLLEIETEIHEEFVAHGINAIWTVVPA
jgi:hypothetical protein